MREIDVPCDEVYCEAETREIGASPCELYSVEPISGRRCSDALIAYNGPPYPYPEGEHR